MAEAAAIVVRDCCVRIAELLSGVHAGPYPALEPVPALLRELPASAVTELAAKVVNNWYQTAIDQCGGSTVQGSRLLSLPKTPAEADLDALCQWMAACGQGLSEAMRRRVPFAMLGGSPIKPDHALFRPRRHSVNSLAAATAHTLSKEYERQLRAVISGRMPTSEAVDPVQDTSAGDVAKGNDADEAYDDDDFEDDHSDDGESAPASTKPASHEGANFFERFEKGTLGRGAIFGTSQSVHRPVEQVVTEVRANETFRPRLNRRSGKLAWSEHGVSDDVVERQYADAKRRQRTQALREAGVQVVEEATDAGNVDRSQPQTADIVEETSGIAGTSCGIDDDTSAKTDHVLSVMHKDQVSTNSADKCYLHKRPPSIQTRRLRVRVERSVGVEKGQLGRTSCVLNLDGTETVDNVIAEALKILVPSAVEDNSSRKTWVLVRGAEVLEPPNRSVVHCGVLPEMTLRLMKVRSHIVIDLHGLLTTSATAMCRQSTYVVD